MTMHKEDARSKKIIFVASCLLNTNNKVFELARYGGFCKNIVETIHKYDLGIQQMDCPETLYLGIQRWHYTKNLYDNVGFRRHCRSIAVRVVDYMASYSQVNYETAAILWCNGSPTCGYNLTSYDLNWGGAPKSLEYADALVEGKGVFVEELEAEIISRGLPLPASYGLNLDELAKPFELIISEFSDFLKNLME